MAYVIYTYTFSNGGLAKSAEVNDNFNKVSAQLNGNVDATNLKDAAVTGSKLAAGVVSATKMATLPQVRVHKGGVQSIPHNVLTNVTWDQEDFDTDAIHDTGANNDRLTCRTAGLYIVTACVGWDSTGGTNSTAQAYVRRRNSGGSDLGVVAGQELEVTPSGSDRENSLAGLIRLAVNDYLVVEAYHYEGDSTAKNVKSGDSHFAMAWISP